MAFFDARSCSVQYVVFDPSTGRCAPVDPVLDYDEKSVPTAAPSADALLAFACESETSRLNEFAILITCGSLQGGHRISERQGAAASATARIPAIARDVAPGRS